MVLREKEVAGGKSMGTGSGLVGGLVVTVSFGVSLRERVGSGGGRVGVCFIMLTNSPGGIWL